MMFRRSARSTLARLSAEAAVNKRLDVVTGRGKVEKSFYPDVEVQPRVAAPVIKRRFWTPDELMTAQP
jgi:hypothetical protein